jgi:hypothetical protein
VDESNQHARGLRCIYCGEALDDFGECEPCFGAQQRETVRILRDRRTALRAAANEEKTEQTFDP